MISPTINKLIEEFKKADLSVEDRSALINVLLEKISVLPLHNTLVISQGNVIVNGKELEKDQAINFIESCHALKDNWARKVIHEQKRYLAINIGVHQGLNSEQIMFSKAALWDLEQENLLLEQLI